MKKIIYLLGALLFLVLFIASPYILDYWQYKSALEAAGGMAVYEGATSIQLDNCMCKPVGTVPCAYCGELTNMCKMAKIPTCSLYQSLTVTKSAGGQTCKTGYLITIEKGGILKGAKNVIIGGTVCTEIKVAASENGCIGCGTAMINNPKVYAFKNKIKAFTDFIIAGFREK